MMSNANVYKSHETEMSAPMSTAEKVQMQSQGGILTSAQAMANPMLPPFNPDGTSDYKSNDGTSGQRNMVNF